MSLVRLLSFRVLLAMIGLACGLVLPVAQAQTTYTASVSTYAFETTATTLVTTNFGRTCTAYAVDDDQASIAFSGGFTFPFAGASYTSLRMFSNGQIQLGTDTGAFRSYTPSALPQGNSGAYAGCVGNVPTTNMLSVGWLDLNPSTAGGSMSYEQKGSAPNRYMVLSWTGVYRYGSTSRVTMQALLYENGDIKYQYGVPAVQTWAAMSPRVGVQVSSTDYTAWTTALTNNSAIIFKNNVLTSFSVTPSTTTASTCTPMTYNVRALNSAGTVITAYVGAVALATSTSHGSWSLSSGAGAFAAGTADSGAASYTFAAGDAGVATFGFSNTHAESMTATVMATGAASTSVAVTFADNALVVAPSDALGYEVVAGRPHAFSLGFYRKDATTGLCGLVAAYTGARRIDAWYAPTGSHPSVATAPGISTASTCSSPVSLPAVAPAVAPSTSNLTLNFVGGAATMYLCTSDVGQYALNVRDDTLAYASSVITGTTSNATARPFGLWIDNVVSGAIPNSGGTATTGAKFIPAQTTFSARVTAKLWASGQDTVLAGKPDAGANLSGNANAQRFAALSELTALGQTPAGGARGALSGNAIASGSFTNGVSTANLQYSEAGSIQLLAGSTNYLGTGFAVPGVAIGPVGRFYASGLSLVSGSVTSACAAGGFTYMDQAFALNAQLRAIGALGGVLTNYDTGLGYAFVLTPSWRAVDSANGVDLGTRLATGTAPTWISGQWTYANSGVKFTRAAAGPDGQYDSLQLALSGADADGAEINSKDVNYSVSGACSGAACNAKAIGSLAKMRYGRLQADNVFGAVLTTLNVPLRTMYWAKNGSGSPLGWAVNTLDSCTTVPYADMSLGNYAGSLSSATLPSGSVAFTAGQAVVTVSRTGGAVVSGSVTMGINLGASAASPGGCAAGLPSVPGANLPHLQSNYCASSYVNNPAAKIIWGAPGSRSGSTIFMREQY